MTARNRRGCVLQASLIAFLAGACSAPTPTPLQATPPQPIPSLQANQLAIQGDIWVLILTLHDEADIVTEMVPRQHPFLAGGTFDLTNPGGDQSKLDLIWIGTVCQLEPVLTITGEPGALLLTLDRGAYEDCELLGIMWGVTLELSEQVDRSNVVVEVHDT